VVPAEDSLVLGEGRRIQLAVLFLDICGWSSRPSFLPHEQATNLQILNLFFTEMVRVAEDYGGEVEKNTGDGLLAYFPNGTRDDGPPARSPVLARISHHAIA
jgi:adenylate cyclase